MRKILAIACITAVSLLCGCSEESAVDIAQILLLIFMNIEVASWKKKYLRKE